MRSRSRCRKARSRRLMCEVAFSARPRESGTHSQSWIPAYAGMSGVSVRLSPHHCLQPRRFDPGDRAHLVLVRDIARDADCAEHRATRILDQHAARRWHQPALRDGGQRSDEDRVLCGALRKLARAEAHAERAPGFSIRDVETQNAGLVLTLERDEMPARVEHSDSQRRAIRLAAFLQRGINDGGSLRKCDGHFSLLIIRRLSSRASGPWAARPGTHDSVRSAARWVPARAMLRIAWPG